MSRTNTSGASFSSYASATFRDEKLVLAGILFPDPSISQDDAPETVEALRTSLDSWPQGLGDCRNIAAVETLIPSFAQPDASDFAAAADSARNLSTATIADCFTATESDLMQFVNLVVFNELFQAKARRQLTNSQDHLWTEGRELMNLSSVALHDPKPDLAFGIAPAAETNDNHDDFDNIMLLRLHQSASCGLIYSPSRKHHICFPGLVYEAKSGMVPLMWAENQVAVGAVRALALLNELASLSDMPFRPCVVALTSAGRHWQIHLAYQRQDLKVILCEVLDKPLWIRNEVDRIKLFVLVSRIKRWLLGDFREQIRTRVLKLWREQTPSLQ